MPAFSISALALVVAGALPTALALAVAGWRIRKERRASAQVAALRRELRESGRRFEDFANVSGDWFWETDLEQRFTYHSGGQAHLQPYPELSDDQLIGHTRPALMRALKAAPDPSPVIAAAMAEGRPFFDVECCLTRPDGKEQWLHLSGMPVHDEDGRATAYRGIGRDVTKQKLAERAVHENEQRYRSIFRNAVAGMYLTDTNSKFVEVNPALARMHGCGTPGEFLEHFPHSDDIYPDTRIRKRIREAVDREGAIRQIESAARRRDGSTFPSCESAWGVYDADGRRIGYEGIIEDMTEKHRAAAAVRESERRYRIVSEMTSDMVYSYLVKPDGSYHVEWIAGTLADTTPKASCESGENCWCEIAHPEDMPILERRFRQLETGGSPVDELRIVDASGEVRWVRLHGRAEFDGETGRMTRIVGAASDITERKRAEEELREKAVLLAHAAKLTNLGHWVWDETEDRLIHASEEVAEMLGMTADEYADRLGTLADVAQFIHRDDRQRYLDVVRQARAENRPYEIEYRFVTATGEERYGREIGEPVYDHNGRAVRSIGAFQDVTELKRTQETLRRAKEAAELANRTKSEFLANMSHELRTPLNAIIGFAEVLERQIFGDLGERNRCYATDIRESGEHLLNIINDILDVSKAEAGAIELAEEQVDLADVFESCLRLVQYKADRGDLTVHPELPADGLSMYADPRRLKQILLNLLSNAVKFTPPKGTITIRGHSEPDGGILLQVADTGQGIARCQLERIMEPFAQSESAISRGYEGTGLGLPLTKALAECHGARISLDSTPGDGTVVDVRFPAWRTIAKVAHLGEDPKRASS